jgi:hypothetical protein
VIAGRTLSCANLKDGRRVLTQNTFLDTLGRTGRPKGGTGIQVSVTGLPSFLAAENLQPFITDELREKAAPIEFRTVGGARALGYDAELLPLVCEAYLDADDAGAVHYTQRRVVKVCKLLIRGLARVGIAALVDEATGYQEDRAKDELVKILEAYISPAFMPWVRRFPPMFFEQIYRLQGWEFKAGTAKRTPYMGHLINKYIYEQLPPGVIDELRERNPVAETGYRRHKHHQFLTPETGVPHLDKQITVVTTLMKVADNKQAFEELFGKAFGKAVQQRLPLVINVPEEEEEE